MNINTAVRRIKRNLGLYAIALPVDVDQMIQDILEDTTIPVFSMYCPDLQKLPITVNTNFPKNTTGPILHILPDFPGKQLLYVTRLEYNDQYYRGGYGYAAPFRGGYNPDSFLGAMLTSNLEKQIIDSSTPSLTFHFEHPRKLYIYDMLVTSSLIATLGFQHDISLQSITPTSEESFFTLALLDVMAGLYPTVKHYDGIDSPTGGRIELKLDDWSQAAEKRETLLEKWNEDYLLDLVGLEYK